MASLTFPPELKPSFFQINQLGEFDPYIKENELGIETRRFTELTGRDTKVTFSYIPLRAEQLAILISFYQSTLGSYFNFSLDESTYIVPIEIKTAIQAVGGATVWRFNSPPTLKTVIEDIYLVDIEIVSLNEDLQDTNTSYTIYKDFKPLNLQITPLRLEIDSKKFIRELSSVFIEIQPTDLSIEYVTLNFEPLTLNTTVSNIYVETTVSSKSLYLNAGVGSLTPKAFNITLEQQMTISVSNLGYTENPPPNIVEFKTLYLNQTPQIQGYYSYMPVNIVSRLVSGSFTPTINQLHLIQSNLGPSSCTLPTGAADNTVIEFADYAGSNTASPTGFGLNPLTITAPAGETIQGSSTLVLNKENASATLKKRGTRWTLTGYELNSATGGGGGTPQLTWESLTTATSPSIPILSTFEGKVMRNTTFGSTDMVLTVPTSVTGFRDGFSCFFQNAQPGRLSITSSSLSLTTINSSSLEQGEMAQLFLFGTSWVWVKL